MMQIVRSTVGDNYSLLIGGRIPSAILAYIPTPFLTRKGERGKGETVTHACIIFMRVICAIIIDVHN